MCSFHAFPACDLSSQHILFPSCRGSGGPNVLSRTAQTARTRCDLSLLPDLTPVTRRFEFLLLAGRARRLRKKRSRVNRHPESWGNGGIASGGESSARARA